MADSFSRFFMASRRALTTGARCLNCQRHVVHSFISSLILSSRPQLPQIQTQSRPTFTTLLGLRNEQDDNLKKEFPFDDAPEPVSKSDHTANTEDVNALESEPWYLQVPEQKDLQQAPPNPFAERQRLPELPKNPPPILEPLLKFVSVDMGLDYLTLLDLRDMNPPPALGSNLLMIFGTARSERHLNVSADRLCRWLRTTYKLRPFADGLLGRNELKLKLRRKNRRSKMLGAAGATDPGSYDDGIHTGWICVNVGAVEGPLRVSDDEGSLATDEGFVGFGEQDNSPRIVVQILTEEKRGEIELESLWKDAYDRAVRREKAQREAAEKEALLSSEVKDATVEHHDSGKTIHSSNVAGSFAPQNALPGQQIRQLHTTRTISSVTHQIEEGAEYDLEPQIIRQLGPRIDKAKAFPSPPASRPGEILPTQPDQSARALNTNIEYLIKLEKPAAIRALGSGEDDRTSTSFLDSFYSSMPLFLEAPHWQARVSLHKHAMEIGHQGYTRQGLLQIMRDMHSSIRVIPQNILMDILYAITRTELVIYPRDGDAFNKPSTAEAALRRSLGLAFEVLEKMDAYGYDVVSDEVFLTLHYAISHPKVAVDDSLKPASQRGEEPALQAPASELLDQRAQAGTDHTDLPFKVQDRYNYNLQQAMKILKPGPLSDRMYNALLETYGSQQHWKSFWKTWDDLPRNMVSRTPEMYCTLFRAAAQAGNQIFAQKALRDGIPQMAQERPPVELEHDLASAVAECMQVAQFDRREPFYVSLKRQLELAANDQLLEKWAGQSGAKDDEADVDDIAYGSTDEAGSAVR